jgi:hypothetical protein
MNEDNHHLRAVQLAILFGFNRNDDRAIVSIFHGNETCIPITTNIIARFRRFGIDRPSLYFHP